MVYMALDSALEKDHRETSTGAMKRYRMPYEPEVTNLYSGSLSTAIVPQFQACSGFSLMPWLAIALLAI